MKNVKQICKEVAREAFHYIDDAISFDALSVEFEMQYGRASVFVETGYKSRHGWLVPYQTVTVYHPDDPAHQSPLLAAAIEKSLPSWDTVEKVQKGQMKYSL